MKTKHILCMLLVPGLSWNIYAQQDSVKTVHETTKTEHTEVRTSTTSTSPALPAAGANKTADPDADTFHRGEFGLRFMPTFSSLALNTYNGDVVQGEVTLSYGYGVMMGFNFNKHVGLQAEVNYNEISQKYKDQNLEREIHISYLNIPVMVSLNTDKSKWVNLNLVAGPQFGINVGSSMKTNSGNNNTDTLHAVLAVKHGDIGLAYGAGLEFALNASHTLRFDLGFRGVYGLVDMDANQSSSSQNTYNVLIRASRKSYAGYAGLTFLF
jgi:hypothetical protein